MVINIWLVVFRLPLWKMMEWVRQLGWWNVPLTIHGKSFKIPMVPVTTNQRLLTIKLTIINHHCPILNQCSQPPTSYENHGFQTSTKNFFEIQLWDFRKKSSEMPRRQGFFYQWKWIREHVSSYNPGIQWLIIANMLLIHPIRHYQ